ncbi:MAG: methyltransferase domain-containing protein [Nanoarchaeota archaeon]
MDLKDYQLGICKHDFWFKSRSELIKSLFLKAISKQKKLKILIIGVGVPDNEELFFLKKYGDLFLIDNNKQVFDFINRQTYKEKKISNCQPIPYKDYSFDVILCSDVLEHIKHHDIVIKEIYRVLKKEGSFVFTVPANKFLYCGFDKYYNHRRRYEKKELKQLLQHFSEKNIFYWNTTLFPFICIQRLFINKTIGGRYKLPKIINIFLYKMLIFESKLINNNIKLPFGLSMVGYAKK